MYEIQQSAFDWGALDTDTHAFVLEKTEAIRARAKRRGEDILADGEDLIAVKARLNHGQFLGWLDAEFGMNERMAERFMQVARAVSTGKIKSDNLSDLGASVLYEITAPYFPAEIREQVTSGQIPASLPAIREAKAALVPPAPITRPEYEPVTRPYTPAPVTPLYQPHTIAVPPEMEFLADLAEQPAPPEAGTEFLACLSRIQQLYEAINKIESLHDDEVSAGLQRLSLEEQGRHAILLRMVRNWANALEARMHYTPEKPFTIINN